MEELIKELKDFIKKEGFIYETGSWINDICLDDDKVIYIEDVLDKIEELEKKYLIKLKNKLNKQFEKALRNDNFELAGNISNQLDLVYEKQLQLKLSK